MSKFASVFSIIKYAPALLGIIKQFRNEQPSTEIVDEVVSTRNSLEDFKRTTMQRLDELEKEHTRLHSRLKDADASITLLKAIIWTCAAFALAAFILALFVVIRVSFLH